MKSREKGHPEPGAQCRAVRAMCRGAGRATLLAVAGLIVSSMAVSSSTSAQPHPGDALADPGDVRARSPEAAGGAPSWRRLELEASKLFVSATTEVSLELLTPAEARKALTESPRGQALPAAGPASTWKIGIETSAMGRRSTEEILSAADGTGLQRFKLRHGSKTYSKTYRFTESGVFLLRTSPANVDEAAGPREGWSRLGEAWYARPAGCEEPIDASSLLYLVSLPGWLPSGEARELCVFSSKTYSLARVQAAGREKLRVGYELAGVSGREKREGEIEARRITVAPKPLQGSEDEPFELLGLSGQLEILVDPKHAVPVEVRGKLSFAGTVAARLRRAELR